MDVTYGEGSSTALEITALLASPNYKDNYSLSLASPDQVSAKQVSTGLASADQASADQASADLVSTSANSYPTQESQNLPANNLTDFSTYSKDTQF